MGRQKRWLALGLLVGVLVLAGRATAAEVVKAAHVPLINFAALYVGIEKGYFREQGIQVDLDRVKSGVDAMAFLASGQLDVGAIGMGAGAFTAFERQMDLKIVATAASQPSQGSPVYILVRKALWDQGSIRKVTDLKGKKVGIAGGPGSTGAFFVAKALKAAAMPISEIEIVNLANADIPLALEKGAVDAGLVGSPFSTMALNSKIAEILSKDFDQGGSSTFFMYSGKFMRDHANVARGFTIALMKGARDLQPKTYMSRENLVIFEKYTGAKEADIRATTPMVYPFDLTINDRSLLEQEMIHREAGWVKYANPVPVSRMVETSFQIQALKVLGPYKP
jgi:NitT/TauT family transport system substrate-binding protein